MVLWTAVAKQNITKGRISTRKTLEQHKHRLEIDRPVNPRSVSRIVFSGHGGELTVALFSREVHVFAGKCYWIFTQISFKLGMYVSMELRNYWISFRFWNTCMLMYINDTVLIHLDVNVSHVPFSNSKSSCVFWSQHLYKPVVIVFQVQIWRLLISFMSKWTRIFPLQLFHQPVAV